MPSVAKIMSGQLVWSSSGSQPLAACLSSVTKWPPDLPSDPGQAKGPVLELWRFHKSCCNGRGTCSSQCVSVDVWCLSSLVCVPTEGCTAIGFVGHAGLEGSALCALRELLFY